MHQRKYLYLSVIVLFLFFLGVGLAESSRGPVLPPPPPTGDAESYLLMDAHSGSLLASHNIDLPVAPASLTKIMTVYVAGQELLAGRLRMDEMVQVGERAWRMGGSRMYLDLGVHVSVSDLLNGIIVQSGNDAAVALAEHIAGSEEQFVEMMNATAQDLGMLRTRFVNSSGMPHKDMHTTARDMAILSQALIQNLPDLYTRHSTVYFEYNNIRQRNRNQLLRRDIGADGIKTGYTRAAGYCLASSAMRDGTRLIAVVMGAGTSSSRMRLSEALLDYGFTWFETRMITARDRVMGTARVWKASQPEIIYGVAQDLYLTLPKGMFDMLEQHVTLADAGPLVAPVRKFQKLGDVTLTLGNIPLLTYDVVALSDVCQSGFWHQVVDSVRLMFH